MKLMRKLAGAFGAAALCVLASGLARAASPDDFFTGKTVTLVIPNAPGGSFDLYGRLVAQNLGRFIPGHPTIVPQNMPGAAGMISANWLFHVAPKDGTALGIVVPNVALAQVMGIHGITYDVRKFNWIGRIVSPTATLFASKTAPTRSIQDLKKVVTIVASTGPLSQAEITSRMMNDLVGTKFRIIEGYKGTGDAVLALERGEVQAAVMPWTFVALAHPDWLKSGQVRPIALYTRKPVAGVKVPSVFELAQTKTQRDVFNLFFGPDEIGQSLVAPPGVPNERVTLLRHAFDQMVKDPAFLAQAQKEKLQPTPASWKEVEESAQDAFKATPDEIATAKKYYH